MLKIDIEPRSGILFVRLSGYLSRRNTKKLKEEVTNLLKIAGIKNIVFNIKELKHIDKYGISAIIYSFKICRHNQGQSFICINQNQKQKLGLEKLKNTKIINDELTAVKLVNS